MLISFGSFTADSAAWHLEASIFSLDEERAAQEQRWTVAPQSAHTTLSIVAQV